MSCDWSCLSSSSATDTTMRIPVVENTLRRLVSVVMPVTTTIMLKIEGMSATSERYIAPKSVILLEIFFK